MGVLVSSDDDSQKLFTGKDAAEKAVARERAWKWASRIGISLIAFIVVFAFGVEVGSGRINFAVNQAATGNLPGHLDYTSVNQVYQMLKSNYDGKLDANKLLDGMKAGLANATGDTHTEYFNAHDAKDFNNQLSGTFTGIGAELGKDANGNLQVIAPIDGFPAAKAGLRAQDLIAEINGTKTTGMTVDAAVSAIRGPKGSEVTLQIVRGDQVLTIKITRDDIKVPSVNSKILDGNIGYLQISQFSDDTDELAQKAAISFKQAGVKGIVLDLRDNPGGLVDAAVDVSNMWVPEGKVILQEKRGDTVLKTYKAVNDNIFRGIPTAVLVNEGSASASEITAGALHDNDVARIFGVKSYGKGSVQSVLGLSGGAELKVTVAKWYRPDGQNIDKKGITPDQIVPMTEDNYKNHQDPQQDAAVTWLQTQIKQ